MAVQRVNAGPLVFLVAKIPVILEGVGDVLGALHLGIVVVGAIAKAELGLVNRLEVRLGLHNQHVQLPVLRVLFQLKAVSPVHPLRSGIPEVVKGHVVKRIQRIERLYRPPYTLRRHHVGTMQVIVLFVIVHIVELLKLQAERIHQEELAEPFVRFLLGPSKRNPALHERLHAGRLQRSQNIDVRAGSLAQVEEQFHAHSGIVAVILGADAENARDKPYRNVRRREDYIGNLVKAGRIEHKAVKMQAVELIQVAVERIDRDGRLEVDKTYVDASRKRKGGILDPVDDRTGVRNVAAVRLAALARRSRVHGRRRFGGNLFYLHVGGIGAVRTRCEDNGASASKSIKKLVHCNQPKNLFI